MCSSLDVGKYFWFSAQCTPTYGAAVFYENYIPRARLVALNACASFIEGHKYRKSFRPDKSTYAYLFDGPTAVGVVWNISAPVRLSLPLSSEKLRAFDTMGNALPLAAQKDQTTVECPVDCPIFLRCESGDYALLEKALADARVEYVAPLAVKANATVGRIEVTMTNSSTAAADGVVDLVSAEEKPPAGWPVAQHFHSLAPGETKTFTFRLPEKSAAREVRVRVGDRQMQKLKVTAE